MDKDDEYLEFKHQQNIKNSNRNHRYKESSKRRLSNILKKKFDTTIIGSLAAFEERFGELWGHGLSLSDLDEDQQYWRDLWMETRSKVLDNGNANLRAAQNEISQYTLSWNRYVTYNKQQD
mgnify:CR=1 FL=1|tara:strand:+ start:10007 stop:10369 length:363 start_codon:yes stop_codon:yes gene_type:complete